MIDPDLQQIYRGRYQAGACVACGGASPPPPHGGPRATICPACRAAWRYCPRCEAPVPIDLASDRRSISVPCRPCRQQYRTGGHTIADERARRRAQLLANIAPIRARYRRGMTVKQIAADLGISYHTAKKRIAEARQIGAWDRSLRRRSTRCRTQGCARPVQSGDECNACRCRRWREEKRSV